MGAIVFANCRIDSFNTKPFTFGAFNLAMEAYCCQSRTNLNTIARLNAQGVSGGVSERKRKKLGFVEDVHEHPLVALT